ncbi:hypothetical protein A5904_01885 [Acidithiobacillus caldus]|uniref:Uncharacterized protein n=2 Tax=Acidithiobacillus caldus TaxID=33059 RepID=F9ZSX9_ACICS|nr:conserved hypothetical protein [Acidithiobacillus caldus SM-1]AIA54377.1 hypothetical protein Acaty_c0490 [Acidithiobacillus caldus ATCC 51756]AUW33919.1 hypothetical protein A5904_01885 [Acidithiobacillus caldus]MBU2728979.1 hypothetical protein [Acidithiobacillus caldus]MBU2734754.1 hypothetical protein [Acidithiobacillus caldus ATCC 51756]
MGERQLLGRKGHFLAQFDGCAVMTDAEAVNNRSRPLRNSPIRGLSRRPGPIASRGGRRYRADIAEAGERGPWVRAGGR